MSWKQYGGLKNLDSYNNISVNNIIADKFTVRDKFLTEFQIIGETQLLGNVTLGDNSSNLIDIRSDIIAERNIDIYGDLLINGKLIITSSGEGFFLKGTDDNRLGINIDNPLAVLDISGSYESVLNVYSDQSNNRNIIARNYLQNGIAVNTIDASSSSIQFYSGTDISNNKETPDSEIKYLNGGILEIITGQDTRILSQVSISQDGRKGHIHNETMIVYDISNGIYKNLYYKDDTIIKGNAFSLIAYNSSANTSMNITTPDGKGAVISGGAYPNDTDRSVLILDVSNNSEEKPQALMIVSGTTNETYNTTTSINKYISQVGKYSLDVNGATYISDSQIKILEEPKMELLDIRIYNNDGIALGSFSEDGRFYIYYTDDGGITWSNNEFKYATNSIIQTGNRTRVNDLFINDSVKCFITQAPNAASLFYSIKTFSNWLPFQTLTLNNTTGNANSVYSFLNESVNHFVVARNSRLDILSFGTTHTSVNLNFNITYCKGYENQIYVVGEGGIIKSYSINATITNNNYNTTVFTERTDISYNIYPSKTYKKVSVYNANNIITIGNGIITYTHNGGLNWYTNLILEGGTDISLNDIHIKSEKEAIVVGDNGIIYVTHDGYRTWTLLNTNYINGGGTGEYLTGHSSNNITGVAMSDDNTFITTHIISNASFDINGNITPPYPESRLLSTYAPSVFNRYNKSTLDVIGSLNVSGDLVLHDRGELKTTDISFGLLSTNTRYIDFGLSGELISIGAKIGLVDLNGRLQVADDVSLNSKLDVQGATLLQGFLDVNNSAHINDELTVDGSLNVTEIYGLNNDTIRIFGLVDMKGRLQVVNDVSFNSKLDVQGATLLQGFLDVNNSAHINDELTVDGSLNVTEIYGLNNDTILMSRPTGLVDMKGRLRVVNDVSFNSKLDVQGATLLQGFLDVNNSAHINDELTVDGSLNVTSIYGLNNNTIRISRPTGLVDMKGRLQVVNDVSFNSKLNVQGATVLQGFLDVNNSAHINDELTVDGSLNVTEIYGLNNDTIQMFGLVDMKGRLDVADDASFNSKVYISDDAILYSNLDVGGNALITGSLTVDGNLNFRGNLSKTDISHNVLISDQLTVRNIADNEVALVVQQDTSISSIAEFKRGNVTKVEIKNNGDISMNSVLKIMNTTTSNNNQGGTAGALYVKGGTRLDGSLNVMGDTHFEGDITFIGSITSISEVQNAILTITSDDININRFTYNGIPLDTDKTSKFNINGGANFNDSISVSKTIYGNKINMTGDVSFNSNAFINSNLYLGGDASLNSKLFVNGQTTLGTVNNTGVPLYVDGSGAMRIPVGDSGDRPGIPEIGYIRYNTDDITFEGYGANNAWGTLGGVSNPEKTTQVYVGDNDEIVFKTNGQIRQIIDNITGDVSLNSKLFINGDVSANNKFYLTGDALLGSNVFIDGDISGNSNLYLTGDALLSSKLFIDGDISANSNLYLTGDALLGSNLTVDGDISANSNLFLTGDISANSNFYLGGDASLNKDLYVGGALYVGSTNDFTPKSIFFGGLPGDTSYQHTIIEARNFASDTTDMNELFLYKGNDSSNPIDADRVRLKSGQIRFDTISSGTSGDLNLTDARSDNTKMIILNNGNIGIGTTDPSTKLQVVGNVNLNDKITTTADTTTLTNTSTNINGTTQITTNAGGFKLVGADHIFMGLYPDNATRRASFGYPSSGSHNLTIDNEYEDGTIQLINNQNVKASFGVATTTLDNANINLTGLVTTGNVLQIGTNTNDATTKTIKFGGTFEDNDYEHCVIENRIWGAPGTQQRELLLFSGNEGEGTLGADRIRLKGANIIFDTYSVATTDRVTETTKMIIRQSGNVGIGTTNPSTMLHVNGASTFNGNIRVTGANGININSTSSNSVGDRAFVRLLENNNTFGYQLSNDSADNTFRISAMNDATIFVDALTINRGTTVLTNTTINLSGTVTTGNILQIGTNTNDATVKTIHFGGTTGDNSYNNCVIENRIWGGTEQRELLLFSGNDAVASSSAGPDRIRLKGANIVFDTYSEATADRVAETTKMIILQTGNVGIGITTPTSKLHVDGSITTNGGDSFDNLLDPTGIWLNNGVGTTLPFFELYSSRSTNYPGFNYSFYVQCVGQTNVFGYVYKTINLRGGSWYTVSGARKIINRSDTISRDRFYIKVQDTTNNIELLSANPFSELNVWFDFNYSFYIGTDVTVEVRIGSIHDVGTVIAPNLCLNKGGISARKVHRSLNEKLEVRGALTVNGSMRIPVGTTENRPITETGLIRFNTTDTTFEGYDGSNWGSLGGVSNSDKSSRIYISDASAIVFETNSIIRETIDNLGNISFNTAINGKINMFQNGTATILEVSDSSNNNDIRIQNQDNIFKLIYDQNGKVNNRIHMTDNEISLLPQYPTSSMLLNYNGAVIGDNAVLLNQLRDKDWKQIGYRNSTGTQLGNTVSVSRDGRRVAFGEYSVNTDVSSNIYIYNVYEHEMTYLQTIPIDGGNVSSIDLNEDGTIIVIGKHNAVPNGQIELWKYDGIDYAQVGLLQNGTTVTAQLGHTTSINNDGTIFAAGQFTNNAGKPGIEGGVLIFNYIGDSITKIADISLNNTGITDLYNQMGRSIELNGTGDRIVIGGTIDNIISGSPLYRVYVYQKQVNGTWNQVLNISNTSGIGMNFGISVAMSNDGKVISIATQEDLLTTETYGQVLVYDLFGTGLSGNLTSSLRGSAIKLMNINNGDIFGSSMSLNDDGTVLAIGTGSHNNFNGQASIYKYLNSDWTIVKTITGTSKSNLGGIHDHDIESGQLISDEDGICVDGTGELVIIGAPNLFTADGTSGSGNGQVYLYRNKTFTLGVHKKLHVNGDIVVENGTIDVSGSGTNILKGGSNMIRATGTYGQNLISVDSVDKIIVNASTTTLNNTSIILDGNTQVIKPQNTGSVFTNPHLKLIASSHTNTTGKTSIAMATSAADNYGISLSANRFQTIGTPEFAINTHDGTANGVQKLSIKPDETTITNTNINIIGATTVNGDAKFSLIINPVNYEAGVDKAATDFKNLHDVVWSVSGGGTLYIESVTGYLRLDTTGGTQSNPTMNLYIKPYAGIFKLPIGWIGTIQTTGLMSSNVNLNTSNAVTILTSPDNVTWTSRAQELVGGSLTGSRAFNLTWNNSSALIQELYVEIRYNGVSVGQDTNIRVGNITITNVPLHDMVAYEPSKFIVKYSGNVGIGTTNPTARLDVYNNQTGINPFVKFGTHFGVRDNGKRLQLQGGQIFGDDTSGLSFYVNNNTNNSKLSLSTDTNTLTNTNNTLTATGINTITSAFSGTQSNMIESTGLNGSNWLYSKGANSSNILRSDRTSGISNWLYAPSGGYNLIDASNNGYNLLRVNNIEKLKTTNTTTTLTNDTININGATTFSGTTTVTGNIVANSLTISPIELGYLDGLTNNIQTQLNSTASLSSVVNITETQTITGAKTFTKDVNILTGGETNSYLRLNETAGFGGFLKFNGTSNRIEIGGTNNPLEYTYLSGLRDGSNLKLLTNNETKYEQTADTTTLTNGTININGNLNCSKIINPFDSTKLSTNFIKNTAALPINNWFTIASGNTNRSWGATFIISINESGDHQYLEFKASYQYGNDFTLTVLNNSYFGNRFPITAIRFRRITEPSTTDISAMDNFIDIRVGTAQGDLISANICRIHMSNNFGNGGLTLLDFQAPTGTTNVIYEKDIAGCIFSVGRDSNLNMINVNDGTTTLTNNTIDISGNVILNFKKPLIFSGSTNKATTTYDSSIKFVDGTYYGTYYHAHANHIFSVATTGEWNMRITSTNVDFYQNISVGGTVTTGNVLQIGTNTNDATAKTIKFGGTLDDNDYDHCVIENRIWGLAGTQRRELLLFSGNDIEDSTGADRIRLKGANIIFDTYSTATLDRITETTKMIIRQTGNVGIGTTNPTSKLHVVGSVNLDGKITTTTDTTTLSNATNNITATTKNNITCNIGSGEANAIYATGGGYNMIRASGTNGQNFIDGNIRNSIRVNNVDKMVTNATETTLNNTTTKIQSGTNDKIVTDANTTTLTNNTINLATYPSVRYVKLLLDTGSNFLNFAELEAYTADGTNVAFGKTVTGSGFLDVYYGYLLVNGIYTDFAHSSTSTGVRFMMVDLGTEYKISRVKIWNRTGEVTLQDRAIGVKVQLIGADASTILKEDTITTSSDTYTYDYYDNKMVTNANTTTLANETINIIGATTVSGSFQIPTLLDSNASTVRIRPRNSGNVPAVSTTSWFQVENPNLPVNDNGNNIVDLLLSNGSYAQFATRSTRHLILNGTQGSNVGIGTTNPTSKLHVVGSVNLDGKITTTTDTTTLTNANINLTGLVTTGNVLQIGTNTNDVTAKTIKFGGTLGDNSYDNCVIENRIWGGTEQRELLLFSGNDNEIASGPDRIRLKGANILFDTYSVATPDRITETTKMIIRQSGNVGIGTTNPSSELHVYDSTTTGSNFTSTPNGFNYDSVNALVKLHAFDSFIDLNNNAPMINAIRISSYGSDDLPTPLVNPSRNLGWKSELFIGTITDENSGISSSRGFISYDRNFSIVKHISSDTETLSGISASTANHTLPNIGATNVTTVAVLTCDQDGNVGIGTIVPSAKLEIIAPQSTSANTNPFIRLMPSTVTDVTGLTSIFMSTSGTANYGISLNANRFETGDSRAKFIIKTHFDNVNGVDAFTINGLNNNVGIGTTNPTSKLHVVGSVNLDGKITTTTDTTTLANETINTNGGTLILTTVGGTAEANYKQYITNILTVIGNTSLSLKSFGSGMAFETVGGTALNAFGIIGNTLNDMTISNFLGIGLSATFITLNALTSILLKIGGVTKVTIGSTTTTLDNDTININGTTTFTDTVTVEQQAYFNKRVFTNEQYLRLGSIANLSFLDYRSGGNSADYDVRVSSTGGTSAVGNGAYDIDAGSFVAGSKTSNKLKVNGIDKITTTANTTTLENADNNITGRASITSGKFNIGTTLTPNAGGNWLTLQHNTNNGSVGFNFPNPECGILMSNTSSNNSFPNGFYTGVVKPSDLTTSIRQDWGITSTLASHLDTTFPSTITPLMTMLYGGNVGIGTTNPGAKLEVIGNLTVNNLTNDAILTVKSIDTKQSVVNIIGTSQGTGILYVGQDLIFGGGIEYNGDNSPVSSGAGSDYLALFRRGTGGNFWTARNLYTNNNWEFRGSVGIGKVPTTNLDVSGNASLTGSLTFNSNEGEIIAASAYFDIRTSDQADFTLRIRSDTSQFRGSLIATSFNATSDIRVKTNIQSIVSKTALEQINQLEPKSYQFYDNATTHYGLIAQEAEQIIPEAVDSSGSRMIPSIRELCKLINGGKTIILDTKTTKDMVPTKLDFDDLSGNKQSVGIESFEGDKYIHLKESIAKHLINQDTVFVHGHEVDDFRSINYNTILTVNIAATKELSNELERTRAELGETRAELNALRELVYKLINK